MNCTTHFLNLEWQHHAWRRRVTSTETLETTITDMWGRKVDVEHVLCHAELVCDACGAVRDDGDCLCDVTEANHCAVRLSHLATASDAGAAIATRKSAAETARPVGAEIHG